MPECSIQTCITSPPYWGLRDYGVPKQIWGGDRGHEHLWGDSIKVNATNHTDKRRWNHTRNGRGEEQPLDKQVAMLRTNVDQGSFCECGAWRGSLGLEPTPEMFTDHIVEIFSEVRRVLRDDGTLWLNLGDSYANDSKWGGKSGGKNETSSAGGYHGQRDRRDTGLKNKDLCGIPWRCAFALQQDGWYLRSDIIWAKPAPMPESVTDRPTRSHEHIFLLAKSERYYYDSEAVKEPAICGDPRKPYAPGQVDARGDGHKRGGGKVRPSVERGRFNGKTEAMADTGQNAFRAVEDWRNLRDVWTVNTQPFPEAHFATFPPRLIEPCVIAGCPPAGKRCDCMEIIETPLGTGPIEDPSMETGRAGMNRPRRQDEGTRPITKLEQRSYADQMKASPHRAEMASAAGEAFAHYIRTDKSGARPLPPELLNGWLRSGWLIPAPAECTCPIEPAGTILDPFAGAGTTGLVAKKHGRKFIGIELNPAYVAMAEKRLAQEVLEFQ